MSVHLFDHMSEQHVELFHAGSCIASQLDGLLLRHLAGKLLSASSSPYADRQGNATLLGDYIEGVTVSYDAILRKCCSFVLHHRLSSAFDSRFQSETRQVCSFLHDHGCGVL